jgi:hypothetical protein
VHVLVVGAVGDDLYNVVLVAHILCAIVGFGAVFLNALYGQEIRKRRGPEGAAVFDANFRVSGIAQYVIYAVFLLGLALVGMSDDAWKFSQTWVWLAIVLFIAAVGLSHGVLQPALRRMRALMGELAAGAPPGSSGPPAAAAGGPPAGAPGGGPPPQVLEMQALGKRIGITGATLDIVLIVILSLMVFKPGV